MYARVNFEIIPPATDTAPNPQGQRFDYHGDPKWILESITTELGRAQALGSSIGPVQCFCDDDLKQAELMTQIGSAITAARTKN